MQPTLIIGLGGTGTGVLELLRHRLHLHTGEGNPEAVRFLYVDSDQNNNVTLTKYSDCAFPLVCGGSVADYANPESDRRKRLQLDDWFDHSRLSTINTQSFQAGVGGVRMFGRLLFLDSVQLPQLKARIITDLQQLMRMGTPQVFVVTSAGGGTGSGTFIDMGYLLRQCNAPVGSTEGIAAIHAANIQGAEPQMRQNSAAMMVELDYFSDERHIFRANYDREQLTEDIGRGAPYNFVTLVAPTQGAMPLNVSASPALDILKGKIADYLFLRILESEDDTAGQTIDMRANPNHTQGSPGARLRDAQGNWQAPHANDDLGYPIRFQTFGVSLRQFPIGRTQAFARRIALRALSVEWLREAQAGQMYLSDAFLNNDNARKTAYEADADSLRELLGLPKPYVQLEKRIRSLDEDRVYQALVRPRNGSTESLVTALTNAAANPATLNRLFHWQEGMRLQPNGEGYIAGTITENYEEMGDPALPQSIPQEFARRVRAITLDRRRGPRWSLRLLRDLEKPLRDEVGYLAEKRNLVLPEVDNTSMVGRPPTIRQAHYANCLFEKEVIGKKHDLLLALGDTFFADEKKRTEQFIRYLEAWQRTLNQVPFDDSEVLSGVVDAPTLADGIAQAAAQNVAFSSNDLQQLTVLIANDDFRERFPQQRGGGTDWGPLEALKSRLDAEIDTQMARNASLQQPVHHWLNIAAQNNGGLPAVARQMVNESLPLGDLDLGRDGYADLVPHLPRFASGWWCESDPNRRDDLYQEWVDEARRTARASGTRIPDANIFIEFASPSPYLLSLLLLRTAFPTRIINGYSPQDRLDILGRAQASAFSRIRPPVPGRVSEEAARCLLIGLALSHGPIVQQDLFAPLPAPQTPRPPQFVLEKDPRNSNITTGLKFHYRADGENRSCSLPLRYQDAVYRLALDEKALNALRNQIEDRLLNRADHGMLRQIVMTHRQHLTDLIGVELTRRNQSRAEAVHIRQDLPEMNLHDVPLQEAYDRLRQWGADHLEMNE